MKKLTLILSSALAVQVLLSIMLFAFKQETGAFQANQSLLNLAQNAYDTVMIEEKGKPALQLKKVHNQWQLPSYFNVPVVASKFTDFTNRLQNLKAGWPVATTEDAASRFQVDASKFERKISFQKDGQPVKTLYLGSTPSFKKIHARVDGQNGIQVINFSTFEASTAPEDWMQQDLIKVDLEQIQQISGTGYSVSKKDKNWLVDGLEATQTTNTASVKTLLNSLTALNYINILGQEDKPNYHLQQPALSLTLKKTSGDVTYQFGKLDGKEEFVLKTSAQPYYFSVSKAQIDPLLSINKEKLLMAKASSQPPQTAQPANQSAVKALQTK